MINTGAILVAANKNTMPERDPAQPEGKATDSVTELSMDESSNQSSSGFSGSRLANNSHGGRSTAFSTSASAYVSGGGETGSYGSSGSLRKLGNSHSHSDGSSSLAFDCSTSLRRKTGINKEIDSLIKKPTTRKSKVLNDDDAVGMLGLTLNKLRFGSIDLVGRNSEVELLEECLERSMNDKTRELLLISGYSGTGKTALAMTLQRKVKNPRIQDPTSRHNRKIYRKGLFISGKFDLYLRDEPYAGVASACRELCAELLALKDREESAGVFLEICDKIVVELGTDLPTLIKIIPELEEVLGAVVVTAAAESSIFQKDDGITIGINAESDGIESSTSGSTSTTRRLVVDESKKKRISYIFCRFFKIICGFFPVIVMNLDDLQWADLASLDMIESLLTNGNIKNFVVVGCYRSNEVDEKHLLSLMIRELQAKCNRENLPGDVAVDGVTSRNGSMRSLGGGDQQEQEQKPAEDNIPTGNSNGTARISASEFHITEVSIDNLELEDVHFMLTELLSMSDKETNGLAEICHRKTHGNAFFLIQFLSHLEEEKLLEFNFGLFTWIWDVKDIESKTSATANVVDLVKNKMVALPDRDTVELLPILACLGSSVQETIVSIVWKAYCEQRQQEAQEGEDEKTPQRASYEPLLKTAVQEGFLEPHGPAAPSSASGVSQYRFVHDNIQEAALSLVDDPHRLAHLKTSVGRILVSGLDERGLEAHLFPAVNLLNEGVPPTSPEQRIDLAALNLRAAQKATELSAFSSSSKYVLRGIELLPSDTKWTDQHYKLTLEMYSLATEVQGYLGCVETMQECADEVLKQEHRPLSDKFRVYNVLHVSTFNRSNEDEAIQLGLDLLEKLGCKFPTNQVAISFATNTGIIKLRAGLKSRTFDEIDRMPVMTDPSKLELMHMLDRSTLYCFFSRPKMVPLLVFKMVELTLRHGLCEYSPPAFANLGLILAGNLEDFRGAARIADYTVKMMEKVKCKNTKARTILLLNWAVFTWSRPLQTLLKPFLNGYRTGLSTGDTESSLWCCHNFLGFGLLAGRNLAMLDNDCDIYIKHMLELEHTKVAKYTLMEKQIIVNLRDDATKDFDPIQGLDDKQYSDEPLMLGALKVYQNRLYVLLGDYESGADLATERGESFRKNFTGNYLQAADAFYRGISFYAMARKKQATQRKFKQLANRELKVIKAWAKKGNPNTVHCERILDAENAALRGRENDAKKLFQEGIVMATKSGFVQDAALASERFGDFLLDSLNDREGAMFRYKESIRFWSDWGASRKVRILRDRYPELCPRPDEVVVVHENSNRI